MKDTKIDQEMIDNLGKDKFERVKRDKKIHDKKFDTKPVGYLKDAMIRFGKNRTNVIATSILGVLILLSIIVPMTTNKNFRSLETELAYLPPRVPLLENIGIFDGTRWIEDQMVLRENIDPETGLAVPTNYNQDYIIMESVENFIESCNISPASCYGGQNELILDRQSTSFTIMSPGAFAFDIDLNPYVILDVYDLSDDSNAYLNIYISLDNGSTLELVETIEDSGEYTFDIFNTPQLLLVNDVVNSKLYIEFVSDDPTNVASLNSITIDDDANPDEVLTYDFGFDLAQYTRYAGQGRYQRANGELLKANFRFRSYDAAFAIKIDNAYPASKYDKLLEEYGETCETTSTHSTPTPENPWLYDEACPITRVYGINEGVAGPGGESFFSYRIEFDYMLLSGFEEIPYYFFGTTSSGKDLFALTWEGLRTSLTIGLVVSAINITIGILYGSIMGYYGGRIDIIMQRFSELIGRIPWLVTLSIFMALIGPGVLSLILILIVSGWIGIASVTRTQFYRYKGREYVLASRTLGAKDSRLIFRHILPNGIGTIITASILSIPLVIFTEAALSYLGFGIGHGQSFKFLGILDLSGVSIGVLLNDGRNQMLTRPYLTIFPAIIISILMITFNMFGNALRDAFNPSLRGSN